MARAMQAHVVMNSARHLVVVAGSAGALAVIKAIVSALPPEMDAAIVLVMHRDARAPSVLSDILARLTALRVREATDGAPLESGTLYIAPPDRHVLVTRDRHLRLVDGHRIRHVLSSANPLFESAARAYGDDAMAIVLSGYDSDGTDGVQAIAEQGGTVLVQDPRSAFASEMPRSAISSGAVQRALPVDRIAPAIVEFLTTPHAPP